MKSKQYINADDILGSYAKQQGTYKDLTAGSAQNLLGDIEIVNDSAYRPTGGDNDVNSGYEAASIQSIQGNAVAWNQLVKNGNFANGTNDWNPLNGDMSIDADGSLKGVQTGNASGGIFLNTDKQDYTQNHKYYISFVAKGGPVVAGFRQGTNVGGNPYNSIDSTEYKKLSYISSPANKNDFFGIAVGTSQFPIGTTANIKQVQLIDLTLIYGEGKEPTTGQEFEADYQRWFGKPLEYEEYDEGSLRPVLMTGIKTVGFNLYEGGDLKGLASDTILSKTIWKNNCGYKGQVYVQLKSEFTSNNTTFKPAIGIEYTDGSWYTYKYLVNNGINNAISREDKVVNKIVFTYDGTGIADYITYSNIQINFVWSGKRNGEYESHWESIASIPITELTSNGVKIFPDGLKKAGNVYDEIKVEGGVTKAIKRVGSVDLGDINFGNSQTSINGYTDFIGYVQNLKVKNACENHICPIYTGWYTSLKTLLENGKDKQIYVRNDIVEDSIPGLSRYMDVVDSRFTDIASLKAAVKGVMWYYELAEPQEYIIDNFELPLAYKIDDFGTEQIVMPNNSSAPTLVTKYGVNAVDTIRRLPIKVQELESKLSTVDNTLKGIDKIWALNKYKESADIPITEGWIRFASLSNLTNYQCDVCMCYKWYIAIPLPMKLFIWGNSRGDLQVTNLTSYKSTCAAKQGYDKVRLVYDNGVYYLEIHYKHTQQSKYFYYHMRDSAAITSLVPTLSTFNGEPIAEVDIPPFISYE